MDESRKVQVWSRPEDSDGEISMCTDGRRSIVRFGILMLRCALAGASRPSDLGRGNQPEQNSLENVLRSMDNRDIVVFGFQELINLENKRPLVLSIPY